MIHSIFKQLFVKVLIQLHLFRSSQKKVVLFPEIGRVKFFLSLTRSHSWMCIRIHIFNFKKQTSKEKQNKARIQKKTKEIKEEKRIFPENRFKKINLRLLGRRFFSSPAFPETRVFFRSYCTLLYCFREPHSGRAEFN